MEGELGKFGWDEVGGQYFVKEWEFGLCSFESKGFFDDLNRGGDDMH